MMFKEIRFNSEGYKKSLKLRERILRVPLGTTLSADDTSEEDRQHHFGMFNASELIACVVIKPLDDTSVKLRQMAVAEHYQGRGIGKRLIQATEDNLSRQGYKRIELFARKSVIGFYQKLGYQMEGEEFREIGIPHIKMQKTISS